MKFLRYKQLAPEKDITFSRQHIKRLQKQNKFPRSVSLGDNTEAFLEEEIDQWKADRVAARDARLAAVATEGADKAATSVKANQAATEETSA